MHCPYGARVRLYPCAAVPSTWAGLGLAHISANEVLRKPFFVDPLNPTADRIRGPPATPHFVLSGGDGGVSDKATFAVFSLLGFRDLGL